MQVSEGRPLANCLLDRDRFELPSLLHSENAAFEALAKFAQALGMSDEELTASEPIPAALAYSAFVAWLALYGSDAELAAAFMVNFAAWAPTAAG